MKKYLFLIMLLASSLFAVAQTLSVASFEPAPTDATAVNHGTKKSDINGRTCALIKVQSTLRGLNFETGTLGLCDADGAAVMEKIGETWVYVPAGTVKLTILHKDFLPLRNYQWGYSLEGGKTYILTLVSGTVRTIVEQEVCQQYVVFNVTPPDALVTFDGNILDVNKGVAKKLVACGTYDYRVEAKKYHTDAGKVSVSDPAAKKVVNVTLRPAFGSIKVSGGNADGGTVYLDNERMGVAPMVCREVASGTHTLKIAKNMYNSFVQTVEVVDGKEALVSPQMQANFARITFKVDNDAEIWVNEVKRGTGSLTDDFEEGELQIRTRLPHHRDGVKTYRVVANAPVATVSLPAPTPIYGMLDITSTPDGATVMLDGVNVGETPLYISKVLEGSHKVSLSKQGCLPKDGRVTVSEGKLTEYSAVLPNGYDMQFSANVEGAMLSVDGGEYVPLPATLSLLPGSHAVSVKKEGYDDFSQTIEVIASCGYKFRLQETRKDLITVKVKGQAIEMVWVEGGSFNMGSNDGSIIEKPVHSVTLDGYYIGKYEVTQALWQAVMGSNPSYFKGDNRPVEEVSWNDCQQFVSKLNQLTGKKFSLPTEAQWEYAARGGSKSKGYTYSGSNNIGNVAWYDGNSNGNTHPVGQKALNELGIYDMSGNVWEWCLDWYDGDYYSNSPSRNPVNNSAASSRVLRGGGWGSLAEGCRVASRINGTPTDRDFNLGLRLVVLP